MLLNIVQTQNESAAMMTLMRADLETLTMKRSESVVERHWWRSCTAHMEMKAETTHSNVYMRLPAYGAIRKTGMPSKA